MSQTKLIDAVIDNLYRVIYEDAYSSVITLNIKSQGFTKAEENYALRLSYGVLENYILLNYYLDELAKKRIKKKIRLLILLALYEIEFMDNNQNHITVNSYVNYAKKTYPFAKNFVHAILRSHLRAGVARFKASSFDDYAIYYSFSPEIAGLLKKSYGEEKAIDIMRHSQLKADLNLRVNLTKCTAEELILSLQEDGVSAKKSDLSDRCVIIESLHANNITSLQSYQDGCFYIQDIASILLADALHINGDEKILDLCSAPGGKALALAEDIKRLGGLGEITACDIFDRKLNKIKENADRLAVNMNILKNDASLLNKDFIDGFDVVLADVPCSGFGIIRKKIEIKYRKLGQNLENMLKLQEEILRKASQYVKKDGRLVYSTCTMNPAENEKQVKKFLKENKAFILDSFETVLLQSASYLQLYTSDKTDGFFIAILKRIA